MPRKRRASAGLIEEAASNIHRRIPQNPFVLLSNKIARIRKIRIDSLLQEADKVRLAMVSLPRLPIRDPEDISEFLAGESDKIHEDHRRACRRRTIRLPRRVTTKTFRSYQVSLEEALKTHEADIVCVNELGFPSYQGRPMKAAFPYSRQLASNCNALVVAGSSHDRDTHLNIGYCFYPGCANRGLPFYKQVSARAEREQISVPATRDTLCTEAFGLQIGVIICLDLADFASMVAAIRHVHLDLLLVPTYSRKTEKLEDIAKSTSLAMPGTVALTNYASTGSVPECLVASFGNLVTPIESHKTAEGAIINLIDIQLLEHRQRKREREKQVLAAEVDGRFDEMTWLFGIRERYATRID